MLNALRYVTSARTDFLGQRKAAYGIDPLSSAQRRSLGRLLQHVAVLHQRPQEVCKGQRLWPPFHRLYEDADAQRLHARPIYFHFREIPETAKK